MTHHDHLVQPTAGRSEVRVCRHAMSPAYIYIHAICVGPTQPNTKHQTPNTRRYFVPNPSYKGKSAAAKPAKADEESGPGPEEVPAELELLKGITGFAEPCMLMALMGGSGAGGQPGSFFAYCLKPACKVGHTSMDVC